MAGKRAFDARQADLDTLLFETLVYDLSTAIVLLPLSNNGLDYFGCEGSGVRFWSRRLSWYVHPTVCRCFLYPPNNGGLVVAKVTGHSAGGPPASYKFDCLHSESG